MNGTPRATADGPIWRLRTWTPGYDGEQLLSGTSVPQVDAEAELPLAQWAPRGLAVSQREVGPSWWFVDGVQRAEAWAEVDFGNGRSAEALFASFAVGAVRVCAGQPAVLLDRPIVQRMIFGVGAGPGASDPVAGYERDPSTAEPEQALMQARARAEVQLTTRLAVQPGDVVVVDGPLSSTELGAGPGASHSSLVGFVKSHRVEYLTDPACRNVLGQLTAGQRSPLFEIVSPWQRWSWYVHLAGPPGWSGIARVETSRQVPKAEAIRLADRTAACLTTLASSPVKDARAPQNLVPVGALEAHLRHRLGDALLQMRRLRQALT